jgi:hypothetical protein
LAFGEGASCFRRTEANRVAPRPYGGFPQDDGRTTHSRFTIPRNSARQSSLRCQERPAFNPKICDGARPRDRLELGDGFPGIDSRRDLLGITQRCSGARHQNAAFLRGSFFWLVLTA